MQCSIETQPLDLQAINHRFYQSCDGAGATVSFIGWVRDFNASGSIDGLELEHYPGMTELAMTRIAQAAKSQFDCIAVSIVHRVGKVENHQPIVWVGAASLHRQAAFDAAMFTMDVLKRDVPLWKKEWRRGQADWVDAKDSDLHAVKRWFDKGNKD